MPVDQGALFPDEVAEDLLEIVRSTDGLSAELPGVEFSVSTVRRMLGNYGAVNEAIAVWNEHAVARTVQSQTLIKDTLPNLDSHWEGPAHRAYRTYANDVIDRIGAVQGKLEQVSTAFTNVLGTIAGQYQEAVDSLTTVASTLARLAGTYPRRVPDEALGVALEAVAVFIEEVSSAVQSVTDSMNENVQSINEVRNAAAAWQVPSPVRSAAPVIGQPGGWRLRPDAAQGA